MFPQTSAKIDYSGELEGKEDAPVVFDAGMSFVMGVKNQAVRQQFKPKAAHLQSSTASSALSSKIRDFLRKTDHVMQEWKRLGRKDTDMHSLAALPDKNGGDGYIGRSRSATNILIKGFQLYSKTNSASIRSSSVTHVSEGDTVSEVDEVNSFAQGRRDEFCICCSMFYC
jgi:myosin-18